MGNNEDVKRDRFVRIVERRVEKAIDALDAVVQRQLFIPGNDN